MLFNSWSRKFMRKLKFAVTSVKQNPLSIIGASIIIFYIIIALLAPILAPPLPGRDPFMIPRKEYSVEPKPPSPEHIFGTTQGQYDIWYGCIWGTITAFRVGFLVALGALALGIVIGTVASYSGGIIDEIMTRFTDIVLALSIILAIALLIALPSRWDIDIYLLALAVLFPITITIIAHCGFKFSGSWSIAAGLFSFVYILLFPSIFKFPRFYPQTLMLSGIDKVLLTLVIVGWPVYAKITRSKILGIKQRKYARAAEAVVYSNIGVTAKHAVPDLTYPTFIMPFLGIGLFVLIAAALSFLGVGAPTGYADWGQLLSLSRPWIELGLKYWHTYVIPGLFLFTFVLGWILLSSAFKGVLYPVKRKK